MRIILTILTFFFTACGAHAKNIYISAAGNNANTGLSTASAWQTIAKLNSSMASILAGDSVLFRRGDTFYGGVVMTKSGTPAAPIIFAAYGTGANPIITGLSTVTGWVSVGTNIWEAPVTNVKVDVNLVLRNGVYQQVGRYPNTNATLSGYLIYTASSPTSITGPALSTTTNWTGAQVAVRLHRWEIKKRIVTSHVGGVVNFNTMADNPALNYGYFFQRDSRTLDQDGEWWYNSAASKLRVYSTANPGTYTYQIATVDTLFKCTNSYITLLNLDFTGCNKSGIFTNAGTGINIKKVNSYKHGGDGMVTWFTTAVTVDSCSTDYCLGAGILVFGPSPLATPANVTIKNSSVNHTALIAGMETSDLSSRGNALSINGGDGVTCINNTVRNSGYNGIKWHGNNVLVKNNFVDSFCSVRDDGAAIYSYTGPGATITRGTNRVIEWNILLHGIGAPDGAPTNDLTPNGLYARRSANFIYNDEGTWDVIMRNNTCGYGPFQGFQGNGNSYLTITSNTTYSIPISHSFQRLGPPNTENPITNMVFKHNVFYPYRWRIRDQAIDLPTPVSPNGVVLNYGIADSNYYSTATGADTSLDLQTQRSTAPTNFTHSRLPFSYLTGTLGLETHSVSVVNTGTLYYNATNNPYVLNFSGLSRKDVFGNVYNNAATIARFGNLILIANGAAPSSNAPPVAVAGSDQILTLPTNNTTIEACGSSDADGAISSFAWLKISGPSGGTLATPTQKSTTVTGLLQGTYRFQLTITDNLGATGKDTVQITVNAAANVAPVASAGVDKVLTLPANSTTLNGSGTDADGTISSYAWVKLTGTGGNIATPNSQSTVISGLSQGVYTYKLTVTDNGGLTDTDTIQVTVNAAPNVAPTANANSDQSMTLPTNATTLTGSGTDTDGSIVGYHWTKISGPVTGNIASPNTANTGINSLVQGIYQFELTVTDNLGATGKDTVQVTVNGAANMTPTVDAGIDVTIQLPANTTTLTGTANDVDGSIVTILWSQFSGASVTITSNNTLSTGITGLNTAGVYEFDLTVTDDDGAVATDRVQVTVIAANIPPVADAGTDKSITLPVNSTVVSGGGTDADGTVDSYLWLQISGPGTATIVTDDQPSTALNSLVAGTYEFELTVTDNQGSTGRDTVEVIVIPAAINQAPNASAGGDQEITLPADSIVLFGSATDVDGTISSTLWLKISGPVTYTIEEPDSLETTVRGLVAGVYQFEITATDNDGAIDKDTVQVTVNAPAANELPFANAGNPQILFLPTDSTTLTGSGTDNDGTIVSYEWKEGATVLGSTATINLTGLSLGIHTYTLTVTDDDGAIGTDTVTVEIKPAPPVMPSSYIILLDTKYIN